MSSLVVLSVLLVFLSVFNGSYSKDLIQIPPVDDASPAVQNLEEGFRVHGNERRRLDDVFQSSSLRTFLHPPHRLEKFKKLEAFAEKALPYPISLKFLETSKPLSMANNAIIAVGLANTYIGRDAANFAGTARQTGFPGDIVVVISPDARKDFIDGLLRFNATVYYAETTCAGKTDYRCSYNGKSDFPVTLLRFFVFQQIISQYSEQSLVMLSDFRDVFFQTNPFRSKHVATIIEHPNQIMMFQEAHPNRVINRCAQNSVIIQKCYGDDTLRHLATYTISSSGNVIGSKASVAVYAFLITSQTDPKLREIYNGTTVPVATDAASQCLRFGVDQGFHNVLLYSGVFARYLDVRLFQQGEGPVNIVGGFFGEKKLLRAFLAEWKVLRGEAPYKYIYNWNGELSPVVHQLDRFLGTEMQGGFQKHMASFQHIYQDQAKA